MNFVRNCFLENFLEGFDQDLQIFYNEVLGKELILSDTTDVLKIKKALKEIVHAYKKETVESLSSSILFDSAEKRYAYILKHSPCFTSAVARHFYHLLQLNPYIFFEAIHHQELNLCCLGGGPASDAVAIAKIVNGLNSSITYGHKNKLHLRVSVVDLSQDWKTTASKVLQTLQETPELCDADRLTVSFEFLKADLTEKWNEDLINALQDADIVTMVYFVSAVHGSAAKNKCHLMLKNVMHALKPGALLFFLDSAKEIHYRSVYSVANSIGNLKQIYGPHLQQFHTLSMKSIKIFIDLYSEQFNISACLSNCFVSSAGWTKERGKMASVALRSDFYRSQLRKINNNLVSICPITKKGKNARRKMMAYNTRKQECFRQKIKNLFCSEIIMDFDLLDDADDLENSFEADCWACDEKMLYATKAKRKRIFTRADHKALLREK